MGCKKFLRPVYHCQHILPVPKVSCPSEMNVRGLAYSRKYKVEEILDGKCPYMVQSSREVKNDDFESIIQITCVHLSPMSRRCSCAKAIAEANNKGKDPRQLTLFELEEA